MSSTAIGTRSARPGGFWRRYRPIVALILLGLSATAAVFALLWRADIALQRLAMVSRVQASLDQMDDRLSRDVEAVSTLGFYIASEQSAGQPIRHEKLTVLAGRLIEQHAGLLALAWVARVPENERAAFELRRSHIDSPGFRITEPVLEGRPAPARNWDEYFPITEIEPRDAYGSLLGYDVYSDPHWRVTLRFAGISGLPAASNRIRPIDEEEAAPEFVVAAPIYPRSLPDQAGGHRQVAPNGFAIGIFDMRRMLESLMSDSAVASGFDYYVFDAEAPDPASLAYAGSSDTSGKTTIPPFAPGLAARGILGQFKVADRSWAVLAVPHRELLAEVFQPDSGTWAALLTGLFATALVAQYLLLALRRSARLLQLNDALERDVAVIAHEVEERRRAQGALQELLGRSRMQLQAVGAVGQSAALLSGEVEELARRVTEEAAHTVGCERANVWLFNEDASELHCIDLYEATPARHSAGLVLTEQEFRNEFDALKSSRYVDADDPLTDPRTAGYVEGYVKPLRITSMLDTVVRVSERNLGVFCLEHVNKPHHWEHDEIAFAGQLADKMALAIASRDRHQAELQMRESEAKFRSIATTAQDAIIMIDAEGKVDYWNPAAERILGYVSSEAVGKQVHQWFAPERFKEDAARGLRKFVTTGEGPVLGKTLELAAVRKDGVEIPVELSVAAASIGSGRHAVGMMRDISERKRIEAELVRLARKDPLTGLANRAVFVEALQKAAGQARRGGAAFAILYLDLDHFKDVNDTLGHPLGDQLLRSVADRLLSSVRETDTVARFGGDEFAVMQSNVDDPTEVAILAGKLLNIVAEPFAVDGNEIHIGTSIGVDVYGPENADPEALLSHADVALYRAKTEGRGTYRFFTPEMDREVRARVELQNELREAIASDQLFLVYQPQVEIRTGRILGVEALVRWRHPRRGVVPPLDFIPIAEKTGLILPLGEWVLREACRQAKTWYDAGLRIVITGINVASPQFATSLEVSAAQLKARRDFGALLASVLKETGLPPGMLEIELTESSLMETTQRNSEMLSQIRALGVRIGIDDFGTGYSSLNYLRKLPVDRLKVAQEFILNLKPESNEAAIVSAAIGLGKALGLRVIAEGVETAEQLDLIRSWGCEEAQGYYYAKPMLPEALEPLLRKGRILPPPALAAAEATPAAR